MVEELDESKFEDFVNQDELVLVDFYANWCGPCKMLSPKVETLSEEYAGKIKCGKLDIDQNVDIAMKYNVMSIPLLILMKNGKTVDQSLGYIEYDELQKFIQKNI